jgi:hypothetical protein
MKFANIGLNKDDINPLKEDGVPILARGNLERLGSVPTVEDIRQALLFQEIGSPRFSMAKHGKMIDSSEYIFVDTAHRYGDLVQTLNLKAINRLLSEGAVMQLDRIHKFNLPTLELKNDIQNLFRVRVETGAFLARSGVGFGAHWDYDNVIAVQLLGSRLWKLAKPTVENILPDTPGSSTEQHPEWEQEFVLNTGDVLFVPRGWWHECHTSGDVGSFHISFGFSPFTIGHIANYALHGAGNVYLPDSGNLAEDMGKVLEALVDSIRSPRFIRAIHPPTYEETLNAQNAFKLL